MWYPLTAEMVPFCTVTDTEKPLRRWSFGRAIWLAPWKQRFTGNYYITFDVDVIDPSLLTGTGTPVPGGFTYYQAKEALQEIAKKGKVVGFEFVEVDPEYEVFQTSSRMSARLIMDFIGAIFKHQGDKYRPPVGPSTEEDVS